MLLVSSRSNLSVNSQQRRKTPSVPVMPKPSMTSLVSRKGTVSGIGKTLPCDEMSRSRNVYLFKRNSQINMHDFTSLLIQQYVLSVTVSKTQNMPHN